MKIHRPPPSSSLEAPFFSDTEILELARPPPPLLAKISAQFRTILGNLVRIQPISWDSGCKIPALGKSRGPRGVTRGRWSSSGHHIFTKWSPCGHQEVTKRSQRGHQIVTKWSPNGHQMVTEWSLNGQ